MMTKVDKDGSGAIDLRELKNALKKKSSTLDPSLLPGGAGVIELTAKNKAISSGKQPAAVRKSANVAVAQQRMDKAAAAKKGGKGSDKDASSPYACRLALALPNGALAVLALHAPTQKKKGGKAGSSHATLDTLINFPVPSAAGGRSDLPDKAPVADISSSRDGRWVAVASANGTVEVFDAHAAEGKGQHHMSTPCMQAPITALGLRAGGGGGGGGGGEDGELVVAMADNQVLFFDLAAKGLSEWSRSHPHLPAHFTRLPVPVDRVAFDPAHPTTVLLGSLDYLCHVDLKVRYLF